MTTKARTQEATLMSFLEAWHNWDSEAYLGFLDEELKQATMPFAMGIPPRSRPEVVKILPLLMNTVKDYEVGEVSMHTVNLSAEKGTPPSSTRLTDLNQLTIHRKVQDSESGKAAVYALSKGTTPVGLWEVEQAIFITFNESRDKIICLEEMLDTAWMGSFFATKLGPYLKEQGAELH